MIPKVHQIVFSDLPQAPLSGYALEATESVRNAFPSCEYHCWGLDEATDFVAEHFDKSVQAAFHSLKPFSYKGDLFKYCLLHVLGGWYIDAGVKVLVSPESVFTETADPDFVLFRSNGPMDAPWNCSLAFLYAVPGHPAFVTAIEEVVTNCERKHYGNTPLCPTMTAFGRALAIHDVNSNIRQGQVVNVKKRDYHRGFRLPKLGMVGARKAGGAKAGDVESIGIHGGNNYVAMWRSRDVYV